MIILDKKNKWKYVLKKIIFFLITLAICVTLSHSITANELPKPKKYGPIAYLIPDPNKNNPITRSSELFTTIIKQLEDVGCKKLSSYLSEDNNFENSLNQKHDDQLIIFCKVDDDKFKEEWEKNKDISDPIYEFAENRQHRDKFIKSHMGYYDLEKVGNSTEINEIEIPTLFKKAMIKVKVLTIPIEVTSPMDDVSSFHGNSKLNINIIDTIIDDNPLTEHARVARESYPIFTDNSGDSEKTNKNTHGNFRVLVVPIDKILMPHQF